VFQALGVDAEVLGMNLQHVVHRVPQHDRGIPACEDIIDPLPISVPVSVRESVLV
jgi:hypothetical protein